MTSILPEVKLTGNEVVLSVLAAVVTSLIGVIVGLMLRSQAKFEGRMERHVHQLRDDLQSCTAQLIALRTVVVLQLPPEVAARLDTLHKVS